MRNPDVRRLPCEPVFRLSYSGGFMLIFNFRKRFFNLVFQVAVATGGILTILIPTK
jgi:hypothetical protein